MSNIILMGACIGKKNNHKWNDKWPPSNFGCYDSIIHSCHGTMENRQRSSKILLVKISRKNCPQPSNIIICNNVIFYAFKI